MAPPNRPLDVSAADGPREEDLRAWLAQYGPALRRYFQKKVSAAEAEDLVQDVFLSMQARGKLGPIDNIEGYLFRIAANVLINRHHREAHLWSARDALAGEAGAFEDLSPERVLIGKQAVERAVAVLETLPPRTREAFLLHRFEEMTYAAIAQWMGISGKGVEKLIKRALKRLTADGDVAP